MVSWISPPFFLAVIISSCLGESNTYENTEGKGVSFYSFPGRPYKKDRWEKWISNVRRTQNITKKLFDEGDKGRFLTFNNDPSNIRLEIVFAVPFLHIPIGAHLQEGGPRPVIDINAKSLVVTSVILFMLVFVVPGLVRLLVPTPPLHYGYSEAGARGFMERVENTLTNLGIEPGECWRKGVCTMVNSAVQNVALGRASSLDKIIDGVTQNTWINRVVPSFLLPTGCLPKTDSHNLFQCPIAFNRSTLLNIISELMKRFQSLSLLNDT